VSERAREIGRKSLHVAMGFVAFSLHFLSWPVAAGLAAAALVHNLFILPRYGGRAVFRGRARREGHDPGIVLYPASVLLAILLFRERLEIVAAAWAFLAFGDGFATIFGLLFGRISPRLPWNRDKSWVGLLGFLLAGAPMAYVLHQWTAGAEWTSDTAVILPIAVVAVILAVVESLPIGIDDNLTVTVGGAGLLYAAFAVDPPLLAGASDAFVGRLPWAVAVNLALALAARAAGSVDLSGMIHGGVLGVALWVFGGGGAFAMLFIFFVMGTVATKVGYKIKAAEGTAQEKGGKRGAPHAWANAGAGVFFAFLFAATGEDVFLLAVVAAFATAASDTLGSEIGQAYGRRTFLITTFRPVPRGTDGAVSLEGTLAGIAGSALLGAAAMAFGISGWNGLIIVVIAAFIGTTLESYLGATLEQAKQINNEAQNFLNTLAGGLAAVAIAVWWSV